MSELDGYLKELFGRGVGTIKPGLERIRKALDHLPFGIDHRPSVLIGGTNGKGSTSAFFWGLVTAADCRAGLFCSPHLSQMSERFWTQDPIEDGDIPGLIEELRGYIPSELFADLSFFELSTLAAFLLFEHKKTQFDIYEVGLGGRLDSTNITSPLVSAIVSIGLDHEEYLGQGYLSITREKLGIARAHRPLFVGYQQRSDVMKLIVGSAQDIGCELILFGRDFGVDGEHLFFNAGEGRSALRLDIGKFAKVHPPFLVHNFALAASMYHHCQQAGYLKSAALLEEVLHRPIPMAPSLVGRFMEHKLPHEGSSLSMIFDVCHNLEGIDALELALTPRIEQHGKLPALVSILADKKVDLMLDKLQRFLDPIVLFKIDHPRGLGSVDKGQTHLHRHYGDYLLLDSFGEALSVIAQNVGDRPLVVCGSVIAVGQVFDYFSVSPRELALSGSFAVY